jgi:hypothetical protein
MQMMMAGLGLGTSHRSRAAGAVPMAQDSRPGRSVEVARLVAAGDEALLSGDAGAATVLFGRAAEREHSSDIERGIVRAHMQGGHYRRALAFAAHVARAHPEAAGSQLFAQLLDVGGQPELARRVLSRTASPAAASTPLGPAATGAKLTSLSNTRSTGMVVDAGRHVVAPASTLPGAGRLWVRDALGRCTLATRMRVDEKSGLALLQLVEPWHDTPSPALGDRASFAGSVAHAMAHASSSSEPAWPSLRSGFLGAVPGEVHLAIPRFEAHRLPGGGVFDAQGRWTGIWVDGPTRDDALLVPAYSLLLRLDIPVMSTAEPRRPMDEIYERAMRWTVQVLAAAVG